MLFSRIRSKGQRALSYGRRHALALIAERSTDRKLAELAEAPHRLARRMSSVLRRIRRGDFREADLWSSRIESERRRLLNDHSPLARGSDAALYDRGVTVSKACRASRRHRDALALFLVVREFAPRRVIELGTNVGVSSAYMAAALREHGVGRLATLEASSGRLAVAKDLHERLGLSSHVEHICGFFDDTLESALKEPVDFAFIDGHHRFEPTLSYFERIWQRASDDAIFVFDDIRWSRDMERAWRRLQADPRLPLVIDLGGLGVCVSSRRPATARTVSPILAV